MLDSRAGMAESVDAADSKSAGGDTVGVRVPLPAPIDSEGKRASPAYFAIPKNTARLRSTANSESSPIRPNAGPTFSRSTVTALSTMT